MTRGIGYVHPTRVASASKAEITVGVTRLSRLRPRELTTGATRGYYRTHAAEALKHSGGRTPWGGDWVGRKMGHKGLPHCRLWPQKFFTRDGPPDGCHR